MLARGALRISFRLETEAEPVRRLHAKYRDLPMSLADASLVRLAELLEDHHICTLDADFTISRNRGNSAIQLIIPAERQ
jgi:predicted nucleic acid-binding protein